MTDMTDFARKGLEGFADEFGGSEHRRFVHTRLHYRAADTQPIKVVDSWAPVELVSVENLIDCPDEGLLDWLKQTRRGPDTHHAYESASL